MVWSSVQSPSCQPAEGPATDQLHSQEVAVTAPALGVRLRPRGPLFDIRDGAMAITVVRRLRVIGPFAQNNGEQQHTISGWSECKFRPQAIFRTNVFQHIQATAQCYVVSRSEGLPSRAGQQSF